MAKRRSNISFFSIFIAFIIFIVCIVFIFFWIKGFFSKTKTTVDEKSIAIVSMIKNPKNLETWLQKHRDLGIARFYIRLEQTPDLESFLKSQPDVYMKIGESSGVNEYKEIQTRQNAWVNEALQLATDDGMSWLIHIDSDEILEGDLDTIRSLPESTRTFWMQNLEAKYKSIPTKQDNCFVAAKYINCANPEEGETCVSYANGKAGGRCAPDVKSFGPHRFKSDRWGNPDPKLDKVVVHHYESCDFEQYKAKYKNLAKQDLANDIPFTYYTESIKAVLEGNDEALERVYRQYRVKGT